MALLYSCSAVTGSGRLPQPHHIPKEVAEMPIPYSQADLEILYRKNLALVSTEQDILFSIERGGRYFLFTPKKFLFKGFARYAFVFGFAALISYPLVRVALAVWLLVALYKFNSFTKYMAALNISRKKVWGLMLLWITVMEIAGVFFRHWLSGTGLL